MPRLLIYFFIMVLISFTGAVEGQNPNAWGQNVYTIGTEEEQNKELLNCLCRCHSVGDFACRYNVTDLKGYPLGSPSCANLDNGPCICEAMGCFRAPLPTEGECYDKCHNKFDPAVKTEGPKERQILPAETESCNEFCAKTDHSIWDEESNWPECGCICEKGWEMESSGTCVPCSAICKDEKGEFSIEDTGLSGPNACECKCQAGYSDGYKDIGYTSKICEKVQCSPGSTNVADLGDSCPKDRILNRHCCCNLGYKPWGGLCQKEDEIMKMPEELDKSKMPAMSSSEKLDRIFQIYRQRIPEGISSNGATNNLLSWFYPEYVPFVCGSYQAKVLNLLDELKFSNDPTERTLLDDWDYGPIECLWGGHQAVVIFPKGKNWIDTGSKVLDPWLLQSPKVFYLADWAALFSDNTYYGIGGSRVYMGNPMYPTVGGNYVNPKYREINPKDRDFLYLKLTPEQKNIFNRMSTTEQAAWIQRKMDQQSKGARAMGNSPLNMYIVDEAGRISGFPGGEPKHEIPDVTIRRVPLIDGTYWTELEYPQDGPYKLVMEGTSKGEARVFIGFGFEDEILSPSIYRYIIQVDSGQSYEIETNNPGSSIKSGSSLMPPLKIDTIDQAWLNSEPEIASIPEISAMPILSTNDTNFEALDGQARSIAFQDFTFNLGDSIKIGGYTIELLAIQDVENGIAVMRIFKPDGTLDEQRALLENSANNFDEGVEKGGLTVTLIDIIDDQSVKVRIEAEEAQIAWCNAYNHTETQRSAKSTEVLLQDDFDDGSYTDSWTIDWSHTGNPNGNPMQQDFEPQELICEGSNCYLRGHTTQDPGHVKNAPVLYARNPTNIGSWQFDSRLLSSEDDAHNFIVLSTGNKSFKDDLYWIAHRSNGISFEKRINRTQYTTLISTDELGGQSGQWYTIKITRNANGLWSLFIDGALVGTAVDTTLTNFPYLMIGRYGDFDNIVVTAG